MEEEKKETPEETPSENVPAEKPTPESDREEELNKHAAAELEAKNRQLFERAKKAEAEAKAAKLEADRLKATASAKSLDIEDYIDISASLEGLDKREQEWLAQQHRLTGQPLGEIRKGEDFLLWQSGYKIKVEKEKALKPSDSQPDEDRPKTVTQRLSELNNSKNFRSNLAEQEKLLEQVGAYKAPKPNPHKVEIGK